MNTNKSDKLYHNQKPVNRLYSRSGLLAFPQCFKEHQHNK